MNPPLWVSNGRLWTLFGTLLLDDLSMPLEPLEYFDKEPSDDAVIWRYLTMFKFRDLMANEELYFRRPDGFDDKAEGIPSETIRRLE